MTEPEAAEAVRASDRAHGPVANLKAKLMAELDRAHRCEPVWVMDLPCYKQVRRETAAYKADDDDEEKWVPSTGDRMFGYRVLVREGGGEPHIEWLSRGEMGL